MSNITWPSESHRVTIIDDIRDAIGRDITINTLVSGIPCPDITDSLDLVTNLSTNQFCPTCQGVYWLNTISGIETKAHVTWKGEDMLLWTPGGQIFTGDCLVQIKYTASAIYYVDNALSFIVDDKEMIKKDVTLRGAPEINRILVTLEQKEK